MKVKPKNRLPHLVMIKVTDSQRKELQANADKYAEGNLSAWIRFAGVKCIPKRGERVPVLKSVSVNFY